MLLKIIKDNYISNFFLVKNKHVSIVLQIDLLLSPTGPARLFWNSMPYFNLLNHQCMSQMEFISFGQNTSAQCDKIIYRMLWCRQRNCFWKCCPVWLFFNFIIYVAMIHKMKRSRHSTNDSDMLTCTYRMLTITPFAKRYIVD